MIKVFGVQGDFFKSPPGRKGIDMRVITGTARGTRLEAPEGLAEIGEEADPEEVMPNPRNGSASPPKRTSIAVRE